MYTNDTNNISDILLPYKALSTCAHIVIYANVIALIKIGLSAPKIINYRISEPFTMQVMNNHKQFN